jgi:hypothetical protein
MLFASSIAALESYLSDTYINRVLRDSRVLRRHVENNLDLQKEKIRVADVYRYSDTMASRVKTQLLGLIWHNLPKVQEMYLATFGQDIKNVIKPLHEAIKVRHDIVHRNGLTRDGQPVEVTEDTITQVLSNIRAVAALLESEPPTPIPPAEDSAPF